MAADGDGGRWGRELAADDDLAPPWEGLPSDPVRSDGLGAGGAAQRPTADPAIQGGGRILGDGFDELGGNAGLPGLDDWVPPTPAPRRASVPSPSVPSPSVPSPSMAPVSGEAPQQPAPNAAEVEVIADYGPAPSNFLASIPYALLVLTRKRALGKALFDLKRLEKSAAVDRDEAMIELGRTLHAQRGHASLAVLSPQLAAADEAGRVAGERTSEWARAKETADAQRASLSRKIEQAERAAAPHRDRETKLATQMNVRETEPAPGDGEALSRGDRAQEPVVVLGGAGRRAARRAGGGAPGPSSRRHGGASESGRAHPAAQRGPTRAGRDALGGERPHGLSPSRGRSAEALGAGTSVDGGRSGAGLPRRRR